MMGGVVGTISANTLPPGWSIMPGQSYAMAPAELAPVRYAIVTGGVRYTIPRDLAAADWLEEREIEATPPAESSAWSAFSAAHGMTVISMFDQATLTDAQAVEFRLRFDDGSREWIDETPPYRAFWQDPDWRGGDNLRDRGTSPFWTRPPLVDA